MTDEEERLEAGGLVGAAKDGQHLPQKLPLQLRKGRQKHDRCAQPPQCECQHSTVCHLTCRHHLLLTFCKELKKNPCTGPRRLLTFMI